MKAPKLRKTELIDFGYGFIAVYHVYFDGELFPMADMFDDIDCHSERWRKRLANWWFSENVDIEASDIHEMFKKYRAWRDDNLEKLGNMLDDVSKCWQTVGYRELFNEILDGVWSCKDRELICS